MHLHTKEPQQLPANLQKLGEKQEADSPPRPSERTNPTNTFDLGLQHCEPIHVCGLSCSVWGTLLSSPRKLIQYLRKRGRQRIASGGFVAFLQLTKNAGCCPVCSFSFKLCSWSRAAPSKYWCGVLSVPHCSPRTMSWFHILLTFLIWGQKLPFRPK